MASTKVPKRFVAPLDDSNIAAGANIASSKLADGSNFTKKDGSVAFAGAQSMGNNKLTNVATPTPGSTDAANAAYVDNAVSALNSIFSSKGAARAMATGNVNISNPGTLTYDTVICIAGDRVFLGSQSAPAEIGIYIVGATAATALVRATDMDAWAELLGALFSVEEGSANISKLILFTVPKAGTIGTTAVTYQTVNTAGLSSSNFVTNESISGTVDGSNTAFTLANTPVAGSVELFIEGHQLIPGAGNDYTISGAAITTLTAPLSGERVTANYRK
jgi:hypothetical protein